MTKPAAQHVMSEEHFAGIGNNVWRDTYAFIPEIYTDEGLAILSGSEATAYVQYESARLKWFGEETEFAHANPNHGKITGVVDGGNIYERVINEQLPLRGLRIAFARRQATKRVCSLLGIDPKSHLKQPEYAGLKDHL
ncbi:MAG: hypothetical protein ACR2FM_03630 [Candidatus Saccharimonadales bacterium]